MLEVTSSGEVATVDMDLEDMYSISSVSPLDNDPPSPPPSPLLRNLDAGGETTTNNPKQGHSQENVSGAALHISPLEAIRELDEAAEDGLSGRRSPGDGAVRAKDQLLVKELPPQPAEKRTEEVLASEDCEEDTEGPHSPVRGTKSSRSIISSNNMAVLEAPDSEACHSHQSISNLVYLHEDSQACPPQKSMEVGLSEEMLETDSTTLERTVVIIGSELDDTGSSVTSMGGYREKRRHTTSPVVPVGSRGELRSSTGTITDLKENKAEGSLQSGEMCTSTKGYTTAEECNSTLIDILTACKAKVEQLEQLKCSSYELTVQLQSAQALATRLQQQVLWLEEERVSRQREVQGLREELQEAQRALSDRSAHAEHISEELRLLRLQLQKRPSASGSSEGQEDVMEEQEVVQQERPGSCSHSATARAEHGTSRVCTLL